MLHYSVYFAFLAKDSKHCSALLWHVHSCAHTQASQYQRSSMNSHWIFLLREKAVLTIFIFVSVLRMVAQTEGQSVLFKVTVIDGEVHIFYESGTFIL